MLNIHEKTCGQCMFNSLHREGYTNTRITIFSRTVSVAAKFMVFQLQSTLSILNIKSIHQIITQTLDTNQRQLFEYCMMLKCGHYTVS